ncbi:MAG: hypothetical protein JSV41_07170 [Gemmatimonadota bacterium]|nr:MAG: hypothetical protein JSV41_07170 [Gemmatimonadota bacterium]
MGGWRNAAAAAMAVACSIAGLERAMAQVVAEPALLTAGIPVSETFMPYVAIPEDALVLGGMLRFPVSEDVDIGGRAGLWLIDDADDTPFVGGDVRYGLLARPLTPGGGQLALSFDVGIGVSDPGPTVWKIPLGFIAGIGFSLAGGDSEIFAHPRFDLGISSGEDDFDAALLLDVGGVFTLTPLLGAVIDVRFGKGPFGEGDRVVVALGAIWRL